MPPVRAPSALQLLLDGSLPANLRLRLPSFLVVSLVTITLLAVFVPLNPDMPHSGLDPSWVFAVNEAVARHLRFGPEFIFTVGPYGSIYTESFHPATDRLMVFGSLLLGASYVISLLYLARGRRPQMILVLTFFCATFQSRNALLLSYPFLLMFCALKSFNSADIPQEKSILSWREMLPIAVSLSALGLLPLVKGTLLIPAAVSTVMLGFFLLSRFPIKQSLPLALIPIASVVFFWIAAGQSPADIPSYVYATWQLISGYTEAMSLPTFIDWRPKAIGYGFLLAYASVLAVVAWSIVRSSHLRPISKWLTGLLFAMFLSIAFKHGYVRTGNERIAFDSLFICTSMICFLYVDRWLIGSLSLVLALVVVIYIRQDPQLIMEVRQTFGVGTSASETGHLSKILTFISGRLTATFARVTYESTWNTYSGAAQGLRLRLTGSNNTLQNRFASAVADIRSEYSVPTLQGTADIYTNEQSVLLATDNRWNPRPMIQSYSAYTPALAKMNEQHLRTEAAPDWILVDLTVGTSLKAPDVMIAIDDRLPSLEDGVSWPALLENYTFTSYDGQFVFLRKNPVIETRNKLGVISKETHRTGETVTLPGTDGPLFAEIDIQPTLLGKLLIALFKPPMLNIVLNLKSGVTKSYRVVSNMMITGFIVSPLVTNTSEFAALAAGDRRFQDVGKVGSISIAPEYGRSLFWSGTYVLTLKTASGGSPQAGS